MTRNLNSSFFLMALPLSQLVYICDEALHLVVYLEYLPLSNIHRLLLTLYVTVHYFEILLDHLKLYLSPGQLLMQLVFLFLNFRCPLFQLSHIHLGFDHFTYTLMQILLCSLELILFDLDEGFVIVLLIIRLVGGYFNN